MRRELPQPPFTQYLGAARTPHTDKTSWRRRAHVPSQQPAVDSVNFRGSALDEHAVDMSALPYPAIVITDNTLKPLFDAFIWSMTLLATRIMPTVDRLGKAFEPSFENATRIKKGGLPIMGPFKGISAQMLGDSEWTKEDFDLKAHYGANRCCWLCHAAKRNFRPLAYDYQDFPDWMQHMRSDADFGEGPKSVLTILPGLSMTESIKCDLMHIPLRGLFAMVHWRSSILFGAQIELLGITTRSGRLESKLQVAIAIFVIGPGIIRWKHPKSLLACRTHGISRMIRHLSKPKLPTR